MKANVLFFDKKPAAEQPWTQQLWVYDLRTNKHFTLKKNPLRCADLDEFVSSYLPGRARNERVESERWKPFAYDELVAEDKVSLDLTWLMDATAYALTNDGLPWEGPAPSDAALAAAVAARGVVQLEEQPEVLAALLADLRCAADPLRPPAASQ